MPASSHACPSSSRASASRLLGVLEPRRRSGYDADRLAQMLAPHAALERPKTRSARAAEPQHPRCAPARDPRRVPAGAPRLDLLGPVCSDSSAYALRRLALFVAKRHKRASGYGLTVVAYVSSNRMGLVNLDRLVVTPSPFRDWRAKPNAGGERRR